MSVRWGLQTAQAAPPMPQAAIVPPSTHRLPLQQPAQPDAVSQMHPELVQRVPGGHIADVLHRQVPLLQLSPRRPQSTQALPPVPQADSDEVVQAPPTQQPEGHVVALQVPASAVAQAPPSQRQAPPTQVAPAAHGALPPQAHVPLEEQRSAAVGLQAVQVAPPVPQAPADGGWQAFPEQHPVGHEVALQTHAPPTQAWPAAQAGPVPQAQAPPAQPSARTESQATQAAPPRPHCEVLGGLQVAPLQQPASHPRAQPEHAPPVHVSGAGQEVQAPPPLPHCAAVSPGRQVLPLQQPDGQVVESQRHAPPTQAWPAAHAGPVPQRHAPPSQRSAAFTSQAKQVPPPEPQRFRLLTTHSVPAQQPAQLAASQVAPGATVTTTSVSELARTTASAAPVPTTRPCASASTVTRTVPT